MYVWRWVYWFFECASYSIWSTVCFWLMLLRLSCAPPGARFLLYVTPGSASAPPGAINGSPYRGKNSICLTECHCDEEGVSELLLGLLINFHEEKLVDAVHRIINGYWGGWQIEMKTQSQKAESVGYIFFSVFSVPLCFKQVKDRIWQTTVQVHPLMVNPPSRRPPAECGFYPAL